MNKLKAEMEHHGYRPIEMRAKDIPINLTHPKFFEYVKMKRAFVFNRVGQTERHPAEPEEVRKTLEEFVQRERKNSKSAYFYAHPENPGAWIVVTE